MIKRYEDIPEWMKCPEVEKHYRYLQKKKNEILFKRIFDFTFSLILLFFLFLPMIIISILIKADSKGPVFFRQKRVTLYGKIFKIHKFRTMVSNADNIGTAITVRDDRRITKIGAKLRDLRLDEIPQLIDVLQGNMSFVGTRPEVVKYVKKYTDEMKVTLLLPAGITSEASIMYRHEAALLESADDTDKVYMEKILPEKMKYNLDSIRHFSLISETKTMIRTVIAVLRKNASI